MSKPVKIILLSLLALLVLIQFFRIDKTNPPVNPGQDFITMANPPAEIATQLRQTCYDCHSNEVVYPWYSNVAPVSWWVQNHVVEGREHLNFSEWGAYNAEDRSELIEESAEEISEGKMPLNSYTWIHKDARLSKEQRSRLSAWFNTLPGAEGEESATPTSGSPGEHEMEHGGEEEEEH